VTQSEAELSGKKRGIKETIPGGGGGRGNRRLRRPREIIPDTGLLRKTERGSDVFSERGRTRGPTDVEESPSRLRY